MSNNNPEVRNVTRAGAPLIKTWRERIGAAADFPLHVPSDVERAMQAEIDELRASWQVAGPLNGIPATFRHDEGAIARCSYCGRYSLDQATLGPDSRQPVCACGKQHGWSGSFVKPGPDAKWSGKAPPAPTSSAIQLTMDQDLLAILGKPCFACAEIAWLLDAAGVHKLEKRRAEHEQASTILYLLNFYLRFGPVAWAEEASKELQRLAAAVRINKAEGSPA